MSFKPGDIIPEAINWEGFELILFGYNVVKFEEFELSYKADFTINTGKGGDPVSWTIKKYTRECKAKLHLDECKYLINLATPYGGDILKLPPAPIVASCAVPDVGTLKLSIPAAKILSMPLKFKQGDDKAEVDMDIGITSYPVITFV